MESMVFPAPTLRRRVPYVACLAMAALLTGFAVSALADAPQLVDGFGLALDGPVRAFAVQPDGKVLVGGDFTWQSAATHSGVTRLSSEGLVDATFDAGPGASQVFALALQPDGKILVGGYFRGLGFTSRENIGRLNADGTADATFDPGAGTSNTVRALALQPDGKVVIAGNFSTVNNTERDCIARLNANGSLDPTFQAFSNSVWRYNALALQTDGKILVAGQFTDINGTARGNVARLNADGTLDATFDSLEGANGEVTAMALRPDGKVLIGGGFTQYDGASCLGVARLNADGSRDTSFDTGAGPNAEITALAVMPDGKVLIGGPFTTVNGTDRIRIARLNPDGSLDTTFDPGTGVELSADPPNTKVQALALQTDGKLLVGGDFTSVNGTPRSRVARFYNTVYYTLTYKAGTNGTIGGYPSATQTVARGASGTAVTAIPDTGYCFLRWSDGRTDNPRTDTNVLANIGVTAVFALNPSPIDGFSVTMTGDAMALAVQPDGSVLLGGEFSQVNGATASRLARVKPNGSLDLTFNLGSGADASVHALALQPDGKILVGGRFGQISGAERNRIARLNTDGSIDTSFDPGSGVEYPAEPTNATVYAVTVQPDGRVLIGGLFSGVSGTARNGIARLNADGSLDTSFDPGSGAEYAMGPSVATVYALALQPDGKVLIGGQFSSVNGAPNNCIARLNADGSPDPDFDPGSGTDGTVEALALQLDGKILVGGGFNQINATDRAKIARLNVDGSLDATFDPGVGPNGSVNVLAVQPDGRVLTCGEFSQINGITRHSIARLNPNGSLDALFDPGVGFDENISVQTVATQADGKILMAGSRFIFHQPSAGFVIRVNTDNSTDATLDPGTGPNGSIASLAVQPDGKILAGGYFTQVNTTSRIRIARFHADGSLDATFDPGAGANAEVLALALQPDGKVVMGGLFTQVQGIGRNRIARLDANGALETTFSDPSLGASDRIFALAVQPDGKILAAGNFTYFNGPVRNRVARLNADGSLDTTFCPTGAGPNDLVWALALQPDGKMVIGGRFTQVAGTGRIRLARLNTDGSLDTTFDPGAGANGEISAIALQPDGKILIGGNFTTINNTARIRLARLNPNGSLDTTFSSISAAGANDWVSTFAIQADGKILVGGTFTLINGVTRRRIARLNTDGSLDTSFDLGADASAGANNVVKGIALQADGKVVMVGDFTQINGTTRNRIARLTNPDSARSEFSVATGGGSLTWTLSGSYPQPCRVLFEDSADGNEWSTAGWGVATPGVGFVGANLHLPLKAYRYLRATASATGGQCNSSVSILRSTTPYYALPIQYTVDFELDGTAGATLLGTTHQIVDLGADSEAVEAKPPAGWLFAKWTKDGALYSTDNPLTLTNVTETMTLTAVFGQYTLVYAAGPNGSIEGSPSRRQIVKEGEDGAAALATPVDGYHFTRWSDGRTDNPRTDTDVAADISVTASFAANVSLAEGFAPNANGAVFAFFAQPDNKILIGGAFTSIDNVGRNRIARLNSDGSLDGTFDPRAGVGNGTVFAVSAQTDGKILIVGEFATFDNISRNNVARLNADGSLDTAFAPASGANGVIRAVAAQPDGKILIGGDFTSFDGTACSRVARLNENGSLDTEFSDTAMNLDAIVLALALQPDGKILIGGRFEQIHGFLIPKLARLNSDGTRDESFYSPFFAAPAYEVRALTLQPDGKILAGGSLFQLMAVGGWVESRVARLNADGSSDTTFVNAIPGPNDTVNAVALLPDGNVLIGGVFTQISGTARNRTARLHADGSLDTTLNPGTGANADVYAVAPQINGRMLIGGAFTEFNGVPRNYIATLLPDGVLNVPFEPGAGVEWPADPARASVLALALQADGKALAGGKFTQVDGVARNRIARFNTDGALDTTFDPGTGANAAVNALALQPDGRILVAGEFSQISGAERRCVARLNADASIDTTFAPGSGAAYPGTSVSPSVFALALQPDGKVLIGGMFTQFNGAGLKCVARLNADSSLDTTFDPGSGVEYPGTSTAPVVNALALQSDGKILIGGMFTSVNGSTRNNVARLNANGSLDTEFNPSADGSVTALALQPDGKILISGNFLNINSVRRVQMARLNSDGTLDVTFTSTFDIGPSTLALQADGRILVGGWFSQINGKGRGRIARLSADGLLDFSFDPGLGANDGVTALALQADGRVLLGGAFTAVSGLSRNRIARLTNPDDPSQALAVAPGGGTVTWAIGGSYPQPCQVLFEDSADGNDWIPLGWAVVAPGSGYRLTGVNLSPKTNRYVRATAWAAGGRGAGSLSILRSTQPYYTLPTPPSFWVAR